MQNHTKKREKNLDRKEYQFYVYVFNQHRVISGWEYKSDAQEHQKEFTEDENIFGKTAIYTRIGLKRLGIDTNSKNAWGTDMEECLHLYEIYKPTN